MKFISVSINKWYKSDVCMHCRPSHQRATFTATKKKENTTVTASYVNKMKISVSVTFVLALWLSMNMVNASPLSHKKNDALSQEKFQAIAQSCGLSAAIQCGSVAASCGATCYNSGITSSTCISCLGSSYSTCKDCIARLYEEKKQAAIESQVKKSIQVLSQEYVQAIEKNKALTQEKVEAIVQSCGWIGVAKCGGVVASCGAICYASLGVGCATCAGSSYSTCKDCFSKLYKKTKATYLAEYVNALENEVQEEQLNDEEPVIPRSEENDMQKVRTILKMLLMKEQN